MCFLVLIGKLSAKLTHYFIQRNASQLCQLGQRGQSVGVQHLELIGQRRQFLPFLCADRPIVAFLSDCAHPDRVFGGQSSVNARQQCALVRR